MKLTKKQAKELSIKKWEYIVSNNGDCEGLLDKYPELKNLRADCGYCEKYWKAFGGCGGRCPLNLKGITCSDEPHPWIEWVNNPTKANAQKVLALIRSMAFLNYWWISKKIKYLPYFLRKFYWIKLYYYNKKKHPDGDFTLEDYINYAKK